MTSRGQFAGELSAQPLTFVTRDGTVLASRLIRPEDASLLLDFFEQLSSHSRRRRFHADMDHLSQEYKEQTAILLSDVDNQTVGGAVLAILPGPDGSEEIVGVARLARFPDQPDSDEAEAAITVRDDFQGRGVGTELLRRMVLLAKAMQIKTVIALIEANNKPALRVFYALGLPTESHTSQAETELRLTIPA